MNLMYELSASCTSLIVETESGPMLARNLDWALPKLARLAINIEFTSAGQPVFSSTTFPGLVGCLTGCKPGAFAISINFRSPATTQFELVQSFLASVASAATGAWPVSFLARRCLEEDKSYTAARATLGASPLISPVYFTVCGVERGEGILITRDRLKKAGDDWLLAKRGPPVQVPQQPTLVS